MVEYLQGGIIRGTKEQRGKTLAPNIGGWKLLGRTRLTSSGDNVTVSNLPNKRYYMVLANTLTSVSDPVFQVGSSTIDTGNNYADRSSTDGGADSTSTTRANIPIGNTTTNQFETIYISNLQNKEKLFICSNVAQNTAGAGNAPSRREEVGKWANTTDSIGIIRTFKSSGTFDIGSELVVLGWDENDTHSSNFWEPLADVTLGSDGDNHVISFVWKV